MKRFLLALSLVSLVPSATLAENKRSFFPEWLTFKKKTTSYFHLPSAPAFTKALFNRSNTEKAGICAGVGLAASFVTAAIFFLQSYKFPARR